MTELTTIDVGGLDVLENPCDLRQDLHVFANYVQEREVKRLHRSNRLSKSDSLRLAKLTSDPEAVDGVRETGGSSWVDFVDELALQLGLVSYDIKGVYAGYTSSEPSFPDNHILFNAAKYKEFVESTLGEQEGQLFHALLAEREGCKSEFFVPGLLGRLEGFSSAGCATGVVPMLDFPQIRRFLLNILKSCEVGVWHSTASLIQYLKENHPYFLIPEKPRFKWGRRTGRYGNFREGHDRWRPERDISERAPDAFERVEGRYVERFLEGASLVLGYVDVAYAGRPYKGVYPSLGHLQAFRVTNRLRLALDGDIPAPRVTVQPNFEIYVESAFYPASVLSKLLPLAELVSKDVTTILRLDKKKAASHLAQNEKLDVVSLLSRLSGQELPRNVARELAEWAEHSEKFTLYEGFALLEGDEDLPEADLFTVEHISSRIRMVHSADDLFSRLEKAERVPLRVKHSGTMLQPLPQNAQTIFVKRSREVRPNPERDLRVRHLLEGEEVLAQGHQVKPEVLQAALLVGDLSQCGTFGAKVGASHRL
ncbi:hypothetical protein ACFLYD_06800 [Chloroflexota bacterium]